MMTIEEQVNDGIKNAMKAHDKVRLETMRNIKKVILEAKTRPGANDRIDDAECIKLIQKLANRGKNRQKFTDNRAAKICTSRRAGRWPCSKNSYRNNWMKLN